MKSRAGTVHAASSLTSVLSGVLIGAVLLVLLWSLGATYAYAAEEEESAGSVTVSFDLAHDGIDNPRYFSTEKIPVKLTFTTGFATRWRYSLIDADGSVGPLTSPVDNVIWMYPDQRARIENMGGSIYSASIETGLGLAPCYGFSEDQAGPFRGWVSSSSASHICFEGTYLPVTYAVHISNHERIASQFGVDNVFLILVDKDNPKKWIFSSAAGVDTDWVCRFMDLDRECEYQVIAYPRCGGTFFYGLLCKQNQYEPGAVDLPSLPGYDPAEYNFELSFVPYTTVSIGATVSLDGTAASGYTFQLTPIDGAPLPSGATGDEVVVRAKDGAFDFGEIEYSREGTFRYRVAQILPKGAELFPREFSGISGTVRYDAALCEARVSVSAAPDGLYQASTEFLYNGVRTDALAFKNTSVGVKEKSVVRVGAAKYLVKSNSKSTVFYKECKKNAKKATVPASVEIKGKRYTVVGIKAKAFAKKKKVKTVTVKSSAFSKARVRNSLKKSNVSVIKVRVGAAYENRATGKRYKLYFAKNNSGANITIK